MSFSIIREMLKRQTNVQHLTWFVLGSDRDSTTKVELGTVGYDTKFHFSSFDELTKKFKKCLAMLEAIEKTTLAKLEEKENDQKSKDCKRDKSNRRKNR